MVFLPFKILFLTYKHYHVERNVLQIENLVMEVPLSLCTVMPRELLIPPLYEFISSLLNLGFRMGSREVSDIIQNFKWHEGGCNVLNKLFLMGNITLLKEVID